MSLQSMQPGEALSEEWTVYAFQNMIGHRCHRGMTHWMWDPKGVDYVCPGCKTRMPEHLTFLSRVALR